MPIQNRTIKCDICGTEYTEREFGEGFPLWGGVHGVALDGVPNPQLCPKHKAVVADFLVELKTMHEETNDAELD